MVVVACPSKGSFTPRSCQNLVGCVQKRLDPADAQIVHCLINDLFGHNGGNPCVQGTGELQPEFIHALAAQQGGQNRHMAGHFVKLLPLFVGDFLESKLFKALGKFRIGFR